MLIHEIENSLKNPSKDDITEFLRHVSPFSDLDETSIGNIAETASIEFYPSGTTILHQDGPASEHLRIVKKGAVKVSIKSGKNEEVVIDSRGEGESFGFLSLISGDKSRANVVASEDTTCYLINKDAVLKLLESHPPFAEFFLVSLLGKYIDKTYKEMRKKSFAYGGDRLLFTTPVGELVTRHVITASQDVSIREAAEIMSENRISSLILVDAGGVPVGITTDRDLRDKVVSKGRDVRDPIRGIMSVSLMKADARDLCFEALLKMVRYGVHHLLVIDQGSLKGIITNHDLMMLQGTSPVSLAREIESQQSIEGLIPLVGKTTKLVDLLLKEGARASNISRVITEINDRLMRKTIEITEKRLGRPPVGYCWIVFGSEGRKEQTFRTDQDNGIIYENPKDDQKAEEAKHYFSALTLLVRDSLLKCGLPLCPADYMASNPQWCQPLKVWKRYFHTWINQPSSTAILKHIIFFDFRPVYGEARLSEELRDSFTAEVVTQKLFLGYMANAIVHTMPPLGFFKSFIVEKNGLHKDKFDLKERGITPLVDAVRLFALQKGIRETSTLERIQMLKEKHTILKDYAEELEFAFEFLMLLRTEHQFDQLEAGEDLDSFINPNKLNNLEKKMLREAFSLISKLQGIIVEKYKQMIL